MSCLLLMALAAVEAVAVGSGVVALAEAAGWQWFLSMWVAAFNLGKEVITFELLLLHQGISKLSTPRDFQVR